MLILKKYITKLYIKIQLILMQLIKKISLQIKLQTKTYLHFMNLGFTVYIQYYCIIAQSNFWSYYYSPVYLSVYCTIYAIFELLGGIIVIPLDKIWSSRAFTILFHIVTFLSTVLIVPLNQISNKIAKQILTTIPIALSGFTTCCYEASINTCSARVSQIHAQAIEVGIGICCAIIQVIEDLVNAFYFVDPENVKEYERSLTLNAIIYFIISACLVLQGLFSWFWLEKAHPSCVLGPRKFRQKEIIEMKNGVANQNDTIQDENVIQKLSVSTKWEDVQNSAIFQSKIHRQIEIMNSSVVNSELSSREKSEIFLKQGESRIENSKTPIQQQNAHNSLSAFEQKSSKNQTPERNDCDKQIIENNQEINQIKINANDSHESVQNSPLFQIHSQIEIKYDNSVSQDQKNTRKSDIKIQQCETHIERNETPSQLNSMHDSLNIFDLDTSIQAKQKDKDENGQINAISEIINSVQLNNKPQRTVLRTIFPLAVGMALNWVVWCIIFPLFMLHVPSKYVMDKYKTTKNDWWTLIVLTVQMGADFIGRILPIFDCITRRISVKFTTILCYLRLIFLVLFPLFALPQAKITQDEIVRPILQNDYAYIAIVILFATSASIANTLGMMKQQELFERIEDKAQGALIVNLFLQIGLFSGCILSLCMIPIFE